MITIETLREYGADTDEAVARCLGNEEFYLKLVKQFLNDEHFDKLKEALAAGDQDEAFSMAHALKGVVTNLSLTPLAEPVADITEALRAKDEAADYAALIGTMDEQLEKLKSLA
ncbi:MAG: Hpt domain-containing protein [Lachnospiraceae bacterium]|nr:Hpt domain-containing protein [Lachnospiraceae bacterium]